MWRAPGNIQNKTSALGREKKGVYKQTETAVSARRLQLVPDRATRWQTRLRLRPRCICSSRWSCCSRARYLSWAPLWLSSPTLFGRIWGQLRGNCWFTSRCLTGSPPSPTPSECGASSAQTRRSASLRERFPLSPTPAPSSGPWPSPFTCTCSSWGPTKESLTASCWCSTLSGKQPAECYLLTKPAPVVPAPWSILGFRQLPPLKLSLRHIFWDFEQRLVKSCTFKTAPLNWELDHKHNPLWTLNVHLLYFVTLWKLAQNSSLLPSYVLTLHRITGWRADITVGPSEFSNINHGVIGSVHVTSVHKSADAWHVLTCFLTSWCYQDNLDPPCVFLWIGTLNKGLPTNPLRQGCQT